jgi:D-3-phosphoglycerate dehydrogenase/glyoxylate/hydroxypyruvate reductase A
MTGPAAQETDMSLLALLSPLPVEPYAQALRRAQPDLALWTTEADAPPDRVEAILAWRLQPGQAARYPNLRMVCSIGAGVDKLMPPDLPESVALTRVVDPGQGREIAQYVLACTLGFTRDLGLYARQQAQAEWRRHPVRPASQCRVGVLGLGEVGQAVARAFTPLGYPVAGWSRRGAPVPGVEVFTGDAGLAALLARSDVLVCTLPLTPATRGLLNRATLSQLPRGAFVVSVGRGEHLVEADLRALLDEGHLAGAALDVFEREPPDASNWVWQHPKLVATPHIAAQASFDTVAAQCLDALRRARDGLPLPHGVDRSAGY